jgi:hypothetical protein
MASSPGLDMEKKVIDDSNSDDAVLAQLGYTQGNIDHLAFPVVANIWQN